MTASHTAPHSGSHIAIRHTDAIGIVRVVHVERGLNHVIEPGVSAAGGRVLAERWARWLGGLEIKDETLLKRERIDWTSGHTRPRKF